MNNNNNNNNNTNNNTTNNNDNNEKDATNVAKYNAKVSLEVHLEWDRYKVAPCCQ